MADASQTATLPYPSLTTNLHPEIELVVALGLGGRNIRTEDVAQHIWLRRRPGYDPPRPAN